MDWKEVCAVLLLVFAALVALIRIIIGRQLNKLFEAFERVPPQEWFIEVRDSIKQLPKLFADMQLFMNRTQDMKQIIDYHEERLRILEQRVYGPQGGK